MNKLIYSLHLFVFGMMAGTVSVNGQARVFNYETNTYENSQPVVSAKWSPEVASPLSTDINCDAGKFWSVENNGLIIEWKLNGGAVTLLDTLFPNAYINSLAYCSLLDPGSISSTLYGDGSNIRYYDGSVWATSSVSTNSLINCGGHGRFLYYMTGGNTQIVRYDGVSATTIFTMPFTKTFGAADLSVDASGNIWCLTGSSYTNIDSLVLIDSIGTKVKTYPLSKLLNSNHYYGTFLMDSTLFIGVGSSNPNNPNTLLPITVSAGKATVGTPIPFGSYYDLASCYSLLGGTPPVAHFNSSDTAFCNESGQCIDFFDYSINSPTSWKWFFAGAVPDTSSLQNPTGICYYTPGTFSVKLVVTNASGSDSLLVPSMIIFASGASVPVLTVSKDTVFSSHASFYQWFFNGSPIGGATDSFYVMSNSGLYNVQITDQYGCVRLGNGITFTGVNEPERIELSIYPNPAQDKLWVMSYGLWVGSHAKLEVYNVLGERVLQSEIMIPKSEINVGDLMEGVYIVEITFANKIYRSKFVKE